MRAYAIMMLLPLAGCATQAQRATSDFQAEWAVRDRAVKECASRIADTNSYRIVNEKLPLGGKPSSLQNLSNADRPTSEEVKAYYDVHEHMSKCRAAMTNGTSGVMSRYAPAFISLFYRSDINASDFVSGKCNCPPRLISRRWIGVE